MTVTPLELLQAEDTNLVNKIATIQSNCVLQTLNLQSQRDTIATKIAALPTT